MKLDDWVRIRADERRRLQAFPQILLRWLFALVYRGWLWNDYFNTHDRVLRVTGWRSAIVESGPHLRELGTENRRGLECCFWWFE